MAEPNSRFMQEAIALSLDSVRSGKGGPFGAVIVKDGEIIAIRDACQVVQTFQLKGCEIYTSCEPCPMCLGAIYWARLDRVYYANTKADAAQIGFDDQFIYDELELPIGDRLLPMIQLMRDEALAAFQEWADKNEKAD